jgi:hypothetical protein
MKRKLLILCAILGFSVLGIQKPAAAIPECSNYSCGTTFQQCICPAGTARTGEVILCKRNTWRADCNYW